MIDRGAELIRYTPDKPVSLVPVVVGTGFRCHPDEYQIFMRVLSSRGFIVLCPTPKLEDGPRKWGIFTNVDLIKQRALLETAQTEGHPNENGIKQVDVVAHSKYALDAVSVAKAHPENFRNLILVAPAGIHPKMNLFRALYRSIQTEENNRQDKVRWAATADYWNDKFGIKRAPLEQYQKNWRCYALEGITTLTKVIYRDLQGLQEAGINVVVLALQDDSRFPQEIYRQLLEGTTIELQEIPGIHRAIKFDPAVANTIGDLLEKNGR